MPASPPMSPPLDRSSAASPQSPAWPADLDVGDLDDGFLSALLPLDDAPLDSAESGGGRKRSARRRAQLAASARRHRSRKKTELLALREAASALGEQLAELRAERSALRPSRAVAAAEEAAAAARVRRLRSEQANAELRRALVAQRRFFGALQGVFQCSAVADAAIDMRLLLHTYTHLGRSAQARARACLAACADRKLDLAVQILLRETEGVDATARTARLTTRPVAARRPNEVSVTTVATYAVDALDLRRAFAAACRAVIGGGMGEHWPRFAAVARHSLAADAPAAHVRYGVSALRFQSQEAEDGGDVVAVDARALSGFRLAGDCGVLLWDFADRDELFPRADAASVSRDVVGAALLRRERCADGVERVVYRSICTKTHAFPSAGALASSATLARYAESSIQGSADCGAVVYNQILAACS